jgi:hypothetical protein
MLENQIEALVAIIKDEDIKRYAGESFWDLIQAVFTNDPIARVKVAKDAKELIFHMPTALFWDKMKRFLFGTFHSRADQLKMAEKFNQDNKQYAEFVKRQIHLINALDDDMKVDYFAALTRCFLLTELESSLYFKLSKFLSICTPEELDFIAQRPYDFKSENTAMISSLYQFGLFTQDDNSETEETNYILSDFAKALKQNCLNFDNGLQRDSRLTAYQQLKQLNLLEPASDDAVSKMLDQIYNVEGTGPDL